MDYLLPAAIQMAAQAHDGQVDKGGQPYILHPLRVMLACPPECRLAAVLHDVVEDSDVNPGLIRSRFGNEVADAVKALTRRKGESYFDFIQRCGANPMARIVKMADLTDNMNLHRLGREPTAEDARRHQKYWEAYGMLIASVDTLPKGQDAKQGLAGTEGSAVGEAETPKRRPQ